METKKIAKQMIEFNKTAFNNTFNALVSVQDQTEKMANTLLNKVPGLPEEGKKSIDNWVKTYKKGREDFKKAVDESFKKAEGFFAVSEQAA